MALTKWTVTAPTPDGKQQRFNINRSIENEKPEAVKADICRTMGRLRGVDPAAVRLEGPTEPNATELALVSAIMSGNKVVAPPKASDK